MRTLRFLLFFLLLAGQVKAATKLNPTITPTLFKYNTPITVVYDVTGTPLANLAVAYAWVWIPANTTIDAKYNVNPAAGVDAAKFVKSTTGGKTLFTLTFTPSDFFTSSISSATQLGILLKAADWTGGQTTDYLATFWDGSFTVKLTAPATGPIFVNNGDVITISAETPVPADYTLKINNKTINVQSAKTVYTFNVTASDSARDYNVVLSAVASGSSSSATFTYLISHTSDAAARPAGIIDGINYDADATKATLSLWAPQKTSVYLIGDFNNWQPSAAYEMKKDGEHFWLAISGLVPGTEYGYQYLVDEKLFIADPYADKILDRANDSYIPASTYPGLKAYPEAAAHAEDYFNRIAVLQTDQTPYAWKATNYTRPAKEKLVIYELLIRDFFDENNRNYQNLIDTIGYFKRLGVNAIELMPITEFSGNDSWGYNPTFMFAPDKYYGTKNKLKEFVDVAHQNGIAVIMDIVMNQQDLPNAYLTMYFDFVNYKPLANNPWFNVTATHPYSVFYDMNHQSTYTKAYLDTINHYWANEYKIDGYRYDLAKGFTQTNNPTNVTAWGQYDPSRIAIFKRMADVLWAKNPDTYIILEYFAENTEEKELANYRVDEGKGMMLWENFNNAYNQISMGFPENSDISASYYANKGWSAPREVAYMESHDEERLMYKNLTFGKISGTYSVKNPATALTRMEMTSLLFYAIPGAKMLWEFGELGYDESINTCSDGTVDETGNCRVSAKPVLWSYADNQRRQRLQAFTRDMIRLRKDYPVFTEGEAVVSSDATTMKQINLRSNPAVDAPSDSTQMNVTIIANSDVVKQTITASFVHTGAWYEYFSAGTQSLITAATQDITLGPGEYRMYTDVLITHPKANIITGLEDEEVAAPVGVYPNPADGVLQVAEATSETSLTLRTMQGSVITPTRVSTNTWDIHELSSGIYIAKVSSNGKIFQMKIIKK